MGDATAFDVAVVGSANVDLVVRVPRRPAGGETLLGGDLLRLPGGKGANQAAAASRCGARVGLVACLGDDADGAFLLARLAEAGVDTHGTTRTADRPTGTAIITITPDGENAIVVSPGGNAELDVDRVEGGRAVWADARVVVMSLEIPLATVDHVAAHATEAGVRVVLNAAPWAELDRATLAVCDPLIVNEHEARDVLRAAAETADAVDAADPDHERLAERLLATGARSVIVTLGAAGCIVVEHGETGGVARVPAHRVPVVDTTGAGDALAAGWIVGGPELALEAAARCIRRMGSMPERPADS